MAHQKPQLIIINYFFIFYLFIFYELLKFKIIAQRDLQDNRKSKKIKLII